MAKYGLKHTIILADGTEINGGAGINNTDDSILWIWPEGEYTEEAITRIFSDSKKTETIRAVSEIPVMKSRHSYIYEGYTELAKVLPMGKNGCQLMMKRPDTED